MVIAAPASPNACLKRPDRLIGLILLGNNLVNFSAASLVAVDRAANRR